MIVEYIRYKLTQHNADELIAASQEAATHLKAAPECQGFELTRCEEAPNSFVLRILWPSTRDHVEGFRKGPHFRPFLTLIRPFMAEIEEMRHYAPTVVAWTQQ